jgi:2-(1,2-epoxy-1,2-dihydrophenyl)acetyl-CoA isomerase
METIRFVVEQGVATLTLDRPTQKNALNLTMRREIGEAVERVRGDRDIRALVLTGAGGAFCSGGDLRGIASAGLDNEGWRNRLLDLHAWLAGLLTLDRPVIAAVDGVAYGAGFSLALTADFILATHRSRFCMSFLRVGGIPDCGAFYTLPRIVGTQRAMEIMLSARELDAEEAHRLGIAFEIHPAERLLVRAQALAQSFVQAPPTAVSLTKRAVNASLVSDLQTMLELEASGQALAFGTDYHRDALARFGRKEAARFQWPERD